MKISGMIKVSIFALNYDTSANSAIEVLLVQQLVLVNFNSIKNLLFRPSCFFLLCQQLNYQGAVL
jgi:hypothetical protein